MSKRKAPRDAEKAAKRNLSNGKLNASLKDLYDDVMNEPVPDEMKNFDRPDPKPES